MGCTPSSHISQTGLVYCKGSDSPSSGNHRTDNAGGGVYGCIRPTDQDGDHRSAGWSTIAGTTDDMCPRTLLGKQLDQQKTGATLKFGPMCLTVPTIKVMLVFSKSDAQCDAIKWATESLRYQCTLVHSPDQALESYTHMQHHLVVVDARQSSGFDALALGRSIRNINGSQYTCLVAVVRKSLAEKEDACILPLIKAGYNRWFLETCNLGICLNELVQLEHNEIANQLKLRSARALFAALDACRDGIILTGPNHDIQYVNHAIEKLLGFRAEEVIGKNAQELHRADSLKADILESINMQVSKGKEWEGTLFHRRKSGECIPLWSKISPVEIHNGNPEYLVYLKEYPSYTDKLFSPDSDVIPYSYSSVRTGRKPSCDVRSLCSEGKLAGLNRRHSFAKFHALTLEAPITKVINILMATQENSPIFVAQALDKVLDILKNTELYSPQITGTKPDDQMTSDLVTGLITSNKSSNIRRMSHEATMKGSNPPPTPTAMLPSLSSAPSNIKQLLEMQADWSFDIIDLERITNKRPLVWLGLAILAEFNVCNTIGCDESVLRNWLSLIESNYHSNPYHNSTHAADVMQATACFLRKLRIKNVFDPLDEAICLLAAIVHDVDHPGKNSAFLCNSRNELAILYNDVSVLESHHAALAFKLTLSDEQVNIFKNLDTDTYRAVRQSIIDMVLATEMTKHFEHLSKFLNVFTKPLPLDADDAECPMSPESPECLATPENIVLIKRMLIKCADVSNPARPLKLCKEWAARIAEEYCAQTDEEKARGLPVVMPTFDRATCSIPKSQIGFMDYFVSDMFDAWDAFGDFPEVLENLRMNYQYWKEQEALRESVEIKKLEYEQQQQQGDPDDREEKHS